MQATNRFGSHQRASWADRHLRGGVLQRANPQPQHPHHPHYQHSSQHSQQQQAGGLSTASPPPAPPPRWPMQPTQALARLAEQQPDFLAAGPPAANAAGCMVVVLLLHRMHTPRGQRQPSRQDVYTMLLRPGMQRESFITEAGAVHTCTADLSTISIVVRDSPEARQAAQAAVAAGSITVEGTSIPITWNNRAAPPVGCSEVTLHQLPGEFARPGVGRILLAAAQQPGEVVAEFLGGSRLTGDAAMPCPAADTVVLWVRTPHDDPLLTKLPASFPVPGRSAAKIEVAGRPSLAPHLWPTITTQLLETEEDVSRVLLEQLHQGQLHDSSQQQQQQQQQQRRQEQPRVPGPGQQQQQQHNRRPQQPQQQQAGAPGQPADQDMVDALPDDLDVHMEPESMLPTAFGQHSGDVQRPEGQLQGGRAAQQGSSMLEEPQRDPRVDQWHEFFGYHLREVLDESEGAAQRAMSEADRHQLLEEATSHFAAELQQQGHPTMRAVRSWLMQRLRIPTCSYSDADDSSSEEGEEPPQQLQPCAREAVRGTAGAAAAAGAAAPELAAISHSRSLWQHLRGAQQQQQQQPGANVAARAAPSTRGPPQQQQQQQPPRRSSRANLGCRSAAYTALHGPSMGHNAAEQGGQQGRGGRGENSNSQPQLETAAPFTPEPSKRRRGRRGGRR